MVARFGWIWVRILTLLALFASAALTVDYVGEVASFCGVESGCAAVRESGFGFLTLGALRLPVPVLGLFGFTALFAATLVREGKKRALWVLLLAAFGGASAAALVFVQALVIGRFCVWCVVADGSALAILGLAILLFRTQAEVQLEPTLAGYRLNTGGWVAVFALLVGAPLAWPSVRLSPPVPPAIASLYVPGKATIVEFVDFECPHCRRLHQILQPLLQEFEGKVVMVRRYIPLAQHPHAAFAARAALCAEAGPNEEKLVNFLFTTEDLSEARIRAFVVNLGVNLGEFNACVSSAATTRKLEAARALFDKIGLRGLPNTYIGARHTKGVASAEAYEEAIEAALANEGKRGLTGLEFSLLCGALGLTVVLLGARRAAPPEPMR
ncbi:MAG: thioredoxin domain-containing protein [Polyangiaceae bacterium]|nr:thioredoxin domain-containing protein [Polyangiaceae bacterium]